MNDDVNIGELGSFEDITDTDPFPGFTDLPLISAHELDDPLDFTFQEFPPAPKIQRKKRYPKIHLVDWFSALQFGGAGADPLSAFVTAMENGIDAIQTKFTTAVNVGDFEKIPTTGDWIISRSSDNQDVQVLVAWAGNSVDGITSEYQQTVGASGVAYTQILDGTAANYKYVFAFIKSGDAQISAGASGCIKKLTVGTDELYGFSSHFSPTPQTTTVTLLTDLVHIDDDTWEKEMATLTFECGVLTGVAYTSEAAVPMTAPADICVDLDVLLHEEMVAIGGTFSKEGSDVNGKAAWQVDGGGYYVFWDSTEDRWVLNDSTSLSSLIAWQTQTSTWPWNGIWAHDYPDYVLNSIDEDACP